MSSRTQNENHTTRPASHFLVFSTINRLINLVLNNSFHIETFHPKAEKKEKKMTKNCKHSFLSSYETFKIFHSFERRLCGAIG